jgi:hypothetical protein
MIRFGLEQMRFLEEQLAEIDEPTRQQIPAAGYMKPGELLRGLPALQENAACWRKWDQPRHGFLMKSTSPPWSGLCPGNHRRAGRCKSSHTNQGNRWLRAALTESVGGFPH